MKRIYVGLAAALSVMALTLTSCGNDEQPQAPTDGGQAGDTNCFSQMNTQQRQELEKYAAQEGNSTKTVDSNANGTQDVCVLESNGSGGYEEHHYKKEDHFGDYLLYSMMLGHSNALMGYGLISGDLSPGDYVALSLLTSIGNDGRAYHPYHRGGDGNWNRQKTVINNMNVTHVHYGNSRPVDMKTARSQKPPAGYESKSTLKPVTSPNTNIKRGGLGVPNGNTNGNQNKVPAKPQQSPKTQQAPKPKPNTNANKSSSRSGGRSSSSGSRGK